MSQMWAECSIPLVAVEPANLRVEPNRNGKTPYGRIRYCENSFQLDPFTVVTPSLPILRYDQVKGRMDIDLSGDPTSLAKWQSLQDNLVQRLHVQQHDWFQTHGLSLDEVKNRFQPFLQGSVLSIYLSTLIRSAKPIWIYKKSSWTHTLKSGMLSAGQSVRLILRLTGIQSFQPVQQPKLLKCHIVMHPIAILIRD